MVRINLRGDNFGVAHIRELGPAVHAIPVLAQARAVVKDDLDRDGKNEIAFAMEINVLW